MPLYFRILLLATPVVSTSERPLRVVTNVGFPVKSAYAPENNVGLLVRSFHDPENNVGLF